MPGIAVILPIILQLLEMAPQLITGGEKVVEAAKSIWQTWTANTAPTADEQKQYDDALDAAHAAFQASATRQDPTV